MTPEQSYLSAKNIPPRRRLIFAMDVPSPEEAKKLAEELGDSVEFYKLGLQLLMADGYRDLIRWMRARGKDVFVDLKFFDVPQTVASAVKQVSESGALFATVHGNDAILEAAVKAKGPLKILAVTALTSLDRADLDSLGFQANVEDLVLSRARRALEIGCDGVISSGMEARALRENLGEKLIVITPGIRPVENRQEDDQKRVMTVEDAFRSGADYIVVGRPIKDHPGFASPKEAAESIQTKIASIFG
ncbi:MAG: orotidine-5'-phosphate decarboxylase [Alphaproteobacteria bacterium]|nr:orotidine-5'-phosphate decarboxylase [Alphaproteobacteria bacterium]